MSLSCSDCFNDLLCSEDSDEIFSGESPGCSSDIDSPACTEESIANFIEGERDFVPGFDYLSRFESRSLDASAREESVAWILKVNKPLLVYTDITISPLNSYKRSEPSALDLIGAVERIDLSAVGSTVQAYYRFQPLTAYLSVNYLDRFLYSHTLPQTKGWPMQLLSVACLSLAAKMEEPLVPSLLDFQVEGPKYIFEPRTIRRMELLVLTVLDWRLRSVTPFSFLDFFAIKIDSSGTYMGFLISRATEIILSNIREANFLEYWPSSIAAAAILCAADEIPKLSLVNPEHAELWCDGLSKEKIMSCYRLMQDLVLDNRRISRRKTPKVLPMLRVTIRARMRSSDSSSSSTCSSSSSLSSSPHKRRKLNDYLWEDDDKGNSE